MAWPNGFTPNYPYQMNTYQHQQTPVNGVIKVSGRESVDAYQLPPNSNMPFFDENRDIVYIKSTDGVGVPTVTEFNLSPIVHQPSVNNGEVLERLEKELNNAINRIQSLEQQLAATSAIQQQPVVPVSTIQATDATGC